MSDFAHDAWSLYIALITVVSIIACAVLLKALSTRRLAKGEEAGTTGHTWDEDLTELNNPLPRWWMWLFYLTIVFSAVYLALYPGLGSFGGYLRWSSTGQLEQEVKRADARYGPIYQKFLAQDVKQVAGDPEARAIGQRLFLTYCAQCHGSDAKGAKGIPSLEDQEWLFGGDPETIKTSIAEGRAGLMPPQGALVGGDEGAKDVAHYVLSLSGRTHDSLRAFRGKAKFQTICAACHGLDGKGNKQIGSPNLTDEVWLHGGSEKMIIEAILKGRKDEMPAHKHLLDEAKIHLLAAYVYGLSQQPR
jgi:cytochrome c oxidase cbb3-type subunit 3